MGNEAFLCLKRNLIKELKSQVEEIISWLINLQSTNYSKES